MSAPQFDADGNLITEEGDGIKALRKQFKAQAAQISQLQEELKTAQTQANRGSVADVLAAHGLDPRVAKFYPTDKPSTADAVAEWIDENGDLFGKSDGTRQTSTTLSPVEIEGYEIIKKIGAAEAHTEMDFKSRLDACKDEAEVMALLAQFGQEHSF